MSAKKIVAIGDSFFYLNDHLGETGFRLSKGILSRLMGKLSFESELINCGKNGWTTAQWADNILMAPEGDIYIILLGTNDWVAGIPLGDRSNYLSRTKGTILGNLGFIVGQIKRISPEAQIFLCNPTERTDVVNIDDMTNNTTGSYQPKHGQSLEEVANAIYQLARENGVINVNTHDKSGITCYNAVKFKRCCMGATTVDLPYPNYTPIPFDPQNGVYPYPIEAIGTTYDGLHPSNQGAELIAAVIADAINRAHLE